MKCIFCKNKAQSVINGNSLCITHIKKYDKQRTELEKWGKKVGLHALHFFDGNMEK